MRSLVVTFHRALPLALSFLCGSLLNDNDSDNDDDMMMIMMLTMTTVVIADKHTDKHR